MKFSSFPRRALLAHNGGINFAESDREYKKQASLHNHIHKSAMYRPSIVDQLFV
jgi:hypothetical protein